MRKLGIVQRLARIWIGQNVLLKAVLFLPDDSASEMAWLL